MDNNKTVVEDNAMDLFMAGPFLQWVSKKSRADDSSNIAD